MGPDQIESLRAALADRYRVDRELGRGGMATVYLAHDLRHNRPVALKVIRPELAQVLGPERFLREIAIAARLNHPHILALHDSGEAVGQLYYVMPYVAGETLRDRLAREGQLPIDQAIDLARQVASALDYAHAQGVVHRDIKPANILLSGSTAVVADFGLARAGESTVGPNQVSTSGLVLGTPGYMSPEQGSGARVTAQSDIYSLGCVLYEMLAGEPPFTAPNPNALLSKHVLAPVPRLRIARPTAPGWLEAAVARSLEKLPADRFKTAGEFAAALSPPPAAAGRRRRWPGVVAAIAVGLALVRVLWNPPPPDGTRSGGRPIDRLALDTTVYVVFPFERPQPVESPLFEDQLISDELRLWDGIAVVENFQVLEATARAPSGRRTGEQFATLARAHGAGRYIHGSILPLNRILRIRATLYQSASGAAIRSALVDLTASLTNLDSSLTTLTEQLLVGVPPPHDRSSLGRATRSVPARQAFASGHRAVAEWDLPQADSAFTSALQYDPNYPQAALWLGLVKQWRDREPAVWRPLVERAIARKGTLAPRDREFVDAIVSGQSQDRLPCGPWARLTQSLAADFVAWYGLATCLARDLTVVPLPSSPSKWAFRSSYSQALSAYTRAFALLPSIYRGWSGKSYERLQDLLYTAPTEVRAGVAQGDSSIFFAFPSWQGDSLAFVPFPAKLVRDGTAAAHPEAIREAVLRQRRAFYQIATLWDRAYPESADAGLAVAMGLELLKGPGAAEAFARARRRARQPDERIRAGSAELWFRLKQATPSDLAGLTAVRALADSLLLPAVIQSGGEPGLLSAIAALTGQATLGARLAGQTVDGRLRSFPPPAEAAGHALLVFASLGGPLDSLRALEGVVTAGISATVPKNQHETLRLELLGRPAVLAFPEFQSRSAPELRGRGFDLLDAQQQWQQGDSAGFQRTLSRLQAGMSALDPQELVADMVLPTALLLKAAGRSGDAARLLAPMLDHLADAAPGVLNLEGRPGALVRAMVLRADLAAEAGHPDTAAMWAQAVTALWTRPDRFLEPARRRMDRLVRPPK